MPRIIVSGDDAEFVANWPYDNFDPETLPEAIKEAVFIGHTEDPLHGMGSWGDYEDEPQYMFALLVNLARKYAEMANQRYVDVLQAVDENLHHSMGTLTAGDSYPQDLLNVGDEMAEFTIIDGRLIVLSNANGEQRFDGEHAVVEQNYRSGTAILKVTDLTWVEAVDWCRDRIENLNTAEA